MGFIVGCASTLRPLLRSVFKLGSSAGPSERQSKFPPSNIAFDDFSGPSRGPNTTSINIKSAGRRRDSQAWDSGSESEERLVKDGREGIQISTIVQQHRE